MSPILVPADEVVEPPVEPPVIVPDYGYGFVLVGGDGSVWDLASGPVFILAGASGFGFPEPEHQWSEPLGADGSVHNGMRYAKREFSLPLEVDGRFLPEDEWRALERALWAALNPRSEALLQVTSPAGDVRRLTFRYAGGDDSVDLDPLRRKDSVYALEGVAGKPFWEGPAVRRPYSLETGAGQHTFPGPPFYLKSSTALESTLVTNPGDEDSWWRATIDGPYDSATIGIGNDTVTLSTPIGAGESRVIETDPSLGRSIRDGGGGLRWREATVLPARFTPVPAGSEVELTMSIGGGTADQTSVLLEFDSLYLRAFA